MPEQPPPTAGRVNVNEIATRELPALLAQRQAEGLAHYGRPLETHNGRDPYQDLIEEQIDGLQYTLQAREEHRDALRRIEELQADLTEYRELFELQERRMKKAIALWQKATGRHDVLPDLGALLEWLMAERSKALVSVARLRRELDARYVAEESRQMTLGELIRALEGMPADAQVRWAGGPPVGSFFVHHRVAYSHLALGWNDETQTVSTLLRRARGALGMLFAGYCRERQFRATAGTPIWRSGPGVIDDPAVIRVRQTDEGVILDTRRVD